VSGFTVPRLSALVARLATHDQPGSLRGPADDPAVLVLDSTAIVEPAPAGSTDRRAFLARASMLSLAIPGVGAERAGTAAADEEVFGRCAPAPSPLSAYDQLVWPALTRETSTWKSVALNGRRRQDMNAPFRVNVGDRVRFRVVSANGRTMFDLVCDVAGEFPFVNLGFGQGQPGAIGMLVVEP